jgi:diguanylate cyclase (GGDEF)-like protein
MNGLKRINDKYGHLAGSRALCRLAETLKQSCRAIDTPTRFGGDEFAIVLPETPEAGGYVVLRRISERLAASDDQPAIAVSGGVAVFPRDGSSPTQLLRAADKVLYESRTRSNGRRRHVVAEAEPEEVRRTGTLF